MRQLHRYALLTLGLQSALFAAVTAHAQDSLRVLRIQPAVAASPVEPFVITFDHPVAPRLDESIDASRVLHIVPAVGARIYWRDPSTIVADFDTLWAAGASYQVRIDPSLRSAAGLALASPQTFVVNVRMPRMLVVFPSGESYSEADTVSHPVAVFDGIFNLAAIAGRVWFVPHSNCRTTDSIPLQALRFRRLSKSADSYYVSEAGGYERDHRLDSLRRVVEFDLPATLARGCRGELRLPAVVGEPAVHRAQFVVREPFGLRGNPCGSEPLRRAGEPLQYHCGRRRITLGFTNEVTSDEVRAHVLIDGQPATVGDDETSLYIHLVDSIRPRQTTRLTYQGTLRNTSGDQLGRDTTIIIVGDPLPPLVGVATGQVFVPRDASALLRVRHVNTDSVTVVIGRLPDSLRSKALNLTDFYDNPVRWGHLVRDTVVHAMRVVAPVDSERVVDIPSSWIPPAWRNDPLLLVRVFPHERHKLIAKADTNVDVQASARRNGRAHALPRVDVIGYYGETTPYFAVVRRSNIAVHVLGTSGNAEVWVTSVRGALQRSGVTVRLLDDSMQVYARATTDMRGRAQLRYSLPGDFHRPLHVEAADGSDRALIQLSSRLELSNPGIDEDSLTSRWWSGSTTMSGGKWLHGSAYTERGIYRPGERVYLGGVVRTFAADSGYRTPGGDSARWSISYASPGGGVERLWSHVGRLSEFGTLADSFSLSRTAQLGNYVASLALRVAGRWRSAARVDFVLAEYRAPEFAVRLDADTVTQLFGGDTTRLRVDARYLFGLPMDGGTVHWWWSESETDQWALNVPGLERYTVGRSDWRYSEEEQRRDPPATEGDAVLSVDGTYTLTVPTRAVDRPSALQIDVTVKDANRQAVTSSTSIRLHAANAYIGMRTRERRWVWRTQDTVAVEMRVVRPDGAVRAGDEITIVAQRDRWINNKIVRDTVWRTSLTSAVEPVTARFHPGVGGSYELIASVVDERGKRAVTGFNVWVAGSDNRWAQRDPRALTLRADRATYAPGDQVSLVVESPGEQRAWVSLRREGILHEQFVDLHAGANEVHVPVPVTAAPSAEIRVMAVRPYGATGNDRAGIYSRDGSLQISVDTTARALRVAVATGHARYRPGDTVHVDVTVRDIAGMGRRSEATLWAVDEGVVSLTDFQRPPILQMLMAGSGGYAWTTSSLVAWMMSSPPAAGPAYFNLDYGSLTMSSSATVSALSSATPAVLASTTDAVRRKFATTPFFTGGVRTDSAGRGTVAFKLPDNVTTFRIYAAAVGDDVFAGSGDTSIIVTQPLIVRAALPRIVRTGDTLFAGAVITQEATTRTPVSLSITTTNVAVSGPATLSDTLYAQRSREVRFPMGITGGDSVTFLFRGKTLDASSATDATEVRLPISPPGRARAHVVTGQLDHAGEVSLAIPEGTDTLRSHVELQLGASALPLVRQYSAALRIYPYHCTEQVASAGRALLARIALQRSIGDSTALTTRDRAQLELAVNVLLSRQRENGGFGYWTQYDSTDPWLTAYTLEFLLGARNAGIAVSASALEHAKKYLVAVFPVKMRPIDDPWIAYRDSVEWPHYAVWTANMLRRIGAPDTTLERDVWKIRHQLGFEERLTLAALFAARSDSAKSNELVNQAWQSAHVEGRRVTLDDSAASRHWIFRSPARPIALLLATTARLQPTHPLLGALFESVVQTGRSEKANWWNTLDLAAVAEALTAAGQAMELSTARTVAVSGPRGAIASVIVAPQGAESLHVAMSALSVREKNGSSLRLGLTSTSSAHTYFAMTLFEVPLARPVRADDAGIGVERWYESYVGGKPITEVREGELVRVRLRITAPADREFVVIDDALPAGLEAVDLSLRTSASLPPFPGAPRQRGDMDEGPPGQRWLYGSWDAGWWTPWDHKEIRDDRVLYFARQLWKGSYQASYVARATTAGVFVRPPAQAEEMYNPAVHGRSDGGTFTVTRAPR
ncbi:MAG: MG2 domain-containing protein [bacterium]